MDDIHNVPNYIIKTYGDAGRKRCIINHEFAVPNSYKSVTALSFAIDGEFVAVGYECGDIQLIHADSGVVVWAVKGDSLAIEFIQFSPHITAIFTCNEIGKAYLRRLDNLATFRFGDLQAKISCFDLDKTGSTIIFGEKSGAIRIMDLNNAKQRQLYKCKSLNSNYHKMPVSTVKSVPRSPTIFLSAAQDSQVKIWDIRTKEAIVGTIRGPYIIKNGLDIHNYHVLTGSYRLNDSIQLWDMRRIQPEKTLNPLNKPDFRYGQYIKCCQYLKRFKSPLIVYGDNVLNKLNILDIFSNKVLESFETYKPIKIKAVATYKTQVAFGGSKELVIGGYYFRI